MSTVKDNKEAFFRFQQIERIKELMKLSLTMTKPDLNFMTPWFYRASAWFSTHPFQSSRLEIFRQDAENPASELQRGKGCRAPPSMQMLETSGQMGWASRVCSCKRRAPKVEANIDS